MTTLSERYRQPDIINALADSTKDGSVKAAVMNFAEQYNTSIKNLCLIKYATNHETYDRVSRDST